MARPWVLHHDGLMSMAGAPARYLPGKRHSVEADIHAIVPGTCAGGQGRERATISGSVPRLPLAWNIPWSGSTRCAAACRR